MRKTARLLGVSGRVVVALASMTAWGVLVCPPAYGAALPPTANPLPGSNFQGGDGNQANASPRIDWQALQRAGRVGHTSDPNASDTVFEGGNKEDEPGEWDIITEADGATPSKANILDMWSSYEVRGDQAFLYLAFAREDAGGMAFLAFELNHDARLWNNGQASIPCRTTGDILVSFEPQSNDVSVILQRWVTSTADAATGCARTGSLEDLAGLTPNVDAQGAVNRAAIDAHLRGFYSGTVPDERFGEAALDVTRILEDAGVNPCLADASIWMHSRSSTSDSASMQDYVAPRRVSVRACAASGTKFHDENGNGRRDRGEPGLPRWEIWADYDNNGIRGSNEPFGITDAEGRYVINNIRPPRDTYWLREALPTSGARRRAARAFVRCSLPNASTPGGIGNAPGGMFACAWGPISTATTTFAQSRDFGNYTSALLLVRKELEPPSDPGRFDLLVNDRVVVAGAGNGASRLVALQPGVYTVSEAAVPGTNPADYRSSVECKRETQRARGRSGPVYTELVLPSRQRTVCTFRNARLGPTPVPDIAIDKSGPAVAEAGDTLRYTLDVTNTGVVPFPASSVQVTDPACDAPPELVGKASGGGGDSSPRTLDPGDTWTYACSTKTTAGADCSPRVVPNTATVTGTAEGTTKTDSSMIDTELRCPPTPPEPGPGPGPGPGPQPPPSPPPSPLVPPGPTPPDSGDAAHAGLILRQATAGCIRTRVPRVNFQGTRIARIQVYVNGQLRRRLTMESLQRRLTPRVQLAPGRYRLSVRVTFDRGTGSPPVTLTRRIRICGVLATRPPFTG